MQTDKISPSAISEAALKVFSRDELMALTDRQCADFETLLSRRLKQAGPPPTVDELVGIKELVLDHLSHPALAALSKPLPTSPTTNSQTSPLPQPTGLPSDAPSGGQSL